MLANHFKLALRNLNKHRTSSVINLLGFTLGLTACIVIYLVGSYELSFDTFHPDSERIFRVVGQGKFGKEEEYHPLGFTPRAMPAAVREEIPGLEKIVNFHNVEMPVTISNDGAEPVRFERRNFGADHAQIIATDPEYFDIFQYKWLAGNPRTALSQPFQVVLTERKAQLYFGVLPPDRMLGKEITYGNDIHATVSGIVKEWNENTDFTFTDFISGSTVRASSLKNEINLDEWNDVWSASQLFVKLAPGTSPEQINQQLRTFSKAHFGPEHGTGDFRFVPALQPLSNLHFNDDFKDNYSRHAHLPTLYGLMGIAGFILLIATFNFINLSTARSAQRGREMGMRKVLGSSRKNLVLQFLGETLLLTAFATVVSLMLIPQVLNAVKSYLPDDIPDSIVRPDVLVFALTATLLAALLAGLYPAWVMSSYRPAQALKGPNAIKGNQKGTLRKTLIVFQFTFSLVFIIATLVISRQLDFIRYKDLGFKTDAIVLVDTEQDDKSSVLAQKIRQLAGVDDVTMQWFAPMGENYMLTRMKYRNGGVEKELDVSAKAGDDHFIPLYGLRLVAGRNYIGGDTLRELVINQAFAKEMGFPTAQDAVGKLVEFNGTQYPVSGVVADFHEQSLHASIKPAFIAHLSGMSKNLGIKLHTRGQEMAHVQETLDNIRAQWAAVYPGKKFNYTFLDESIASVYEKERKTARIVRAATAIAILISCMGLFGLITFMAEQRSKEIGVRKVLGASVLSVVSLLSADFLKLIFIAFVVASPIAWYLMQQWLSDYAYRIHIEWWMFAASGLAAVAIALLTIGFQSVRAALANPVSALKE